MQFDKDVPFKNWTLTPFEGLYGGDNYKFEAGGTYNVPSSLADHFAKQLAVRELHALGTVKGEMLSDPDMKEYMAKCFPVKRAVNATSSTFERIDIVADVPAEPAVGIADANKTVSDEQSETSDDDDDDTPDEKNNAGTPKFKKPMGRPRKDAQYTK